MARRNKASWWTRLSYWRRQRRVQNAVTLCVVLLGPVLALATFLVLGPLDQNVSAPSLRFVLLLDLVYVLVVAALVLQRVAKMIAARRARSAGSRLHLRLTGVFALMALIPTVTVAIFAGLTINMGLEAWFSQRVQRVVGNSLAAAQAYENEHRRDLEQDATALASYLNRRSAEVRFAGTANLGDVLREGQLQIQRGLREAFIVDGTGEVRTRGDRSYLFDFDELAPVEIESARINGIHIIEDWQNNEFRAILNLTGYVDHYLYVSRQVDGQILQLLDETQETALFYQQQESERGRRLFEFGLIYIGFALILILAAVWLGLWFAERLSRPVGRLAGAAQRVGSGNLDVQVLEEEGDDEIAMLGRYFNQMTRQLKGQRETMLENNRQIERRRRMFDSVLTSVTSGVVGLDEEGRVSFVNRSAERLLGWHETQTDVALSVAVPEFGPLLEKLRKGHMNTAQDEIKVSRDGQLENLLVRMSRRRREDGTLEGYVVAFDDVTDLVTAQRMAAWGDVARRIAHEIKNPLTPIQLSAERIQRKFTPLLGENSEKLEQMTGVIIRQTGDLRRIVDEFSKFARMPEPDRRSDDLIALVRDAAILQEAGQPDVSFDISLPEGEMIVELDATMISQALTNLIKNAGEAIESYAEKFGLADLVSEVSVTLSVEKSDAVIKIADSGIGLPEDRARLFEPYVTTRDKGTGLGLPIVKKIIEEHGGSLVLTDAPLINGQGRPGAMAVVRLPLLAAGEAALASEET
ncbi:PAS domain-containing sensor histidine kinase [Planktotalea sp.]|uniref:sensor histidine kinase NtrY-like n=1 Tax=Planktotalea sp. TaxID=2029877 RepID=UPI003298D116